MIGQRFDALGAKLGGEFIVNEQTTSIQDDSDVIALAGGRFVVVWKSFTSGDAGDGDNYGAFGRLFVA